jgi:hypothetical protein
MVQNQSMEFVLWEQAIADIHFRISDLHLQGTMRNGICRVSIRDLESDVALL